MDAIRTEYIHKNQQDAWAMLLQYISVPMLSEMICTYAYPIPLHTFESLLARHPDGFAIAFYLDQQHEEDQLGVDVEELRENHSRGLTKMVLDKRREIGYYKASYL